MTAATEPGALRRHWARLLAAAAVVAMVVLAGPTAAGAHPLGNVSVNHYAGLVVGTDEIRIDYVLDLAELPTVREAQEIDADGDGVLADGERAAYERTRCEELASGLDLRVDGRRAALAVEGRELELLEGAAGLDILRLECDLHAPVGVDTEATSITFTDDNPGARVGWREVTAVGDRVTLDESDVAAESVSARLVDYPEDGPTLAVTSAALVASPGGAAAPAIDAPFGERARAATDRFTSLIASDDITVPLVLTSLVVAMAFGALHSLAPGHGKSIIAAYLVGQQRDRRLAIVLGLTVALTHTASVLVFGGVLTITESAAPERFYPYFGVISGLLFVGLGIALLHQVMTRHRGDPPMHHAVEPVLAGVTVGGAVPHVHHDHDHHDHHHHDHVHGPGHEHDGGGWHEHEHVDLGAVASGELGWRGVILPGLAGGIVPSPSALLVFLGGLALGRAWFGVGLVLGYGAGIAATLVTAGWLLARAGDSVTGGSALERFPRLRRLAGYLPVITAVLVIVGGTRLALLAVLDA